MAHYSRRTNNSLNFSQFTTLVLRISKRISRVCWPRKISVAKIGHRFTALYLWVRELFLKVPNFRAAKSRKSSFFYDESWDNRWSSKSHHACMFGRVVTEVNAVKFAKGKFFEIFSINRQQSRFYLPSLQHKTQKFQWMEIILNDYHKKVNAEMRQKVAYWKEHPLSRTESLRRLKLLREQRLASQFWCCRW